MSSIVSESKESKMGKTLVIGLVSVLLLSALFMGCIQDGQEDPEGTFDLMVERINDEDGEGVVELTDTEFLDDDIWEEIPDHQDDYEERLDAFQDAIDDGEMEIDSHETEVTYMEDMDEENKTDYEDLIETLSDSEYFDATVDDFSIVEYEWEVEIEDDSVLKEWFEPEEAEGFEQAIGMLEIDGEWYISFLATSAVLYEDIGGVGNGEPQ